MGPIRRGTGGKCRTRKYGTKAACHAATKRKGLFRCLCLFKREKVQTLGYPLKTTFLSLYSPLIPTSQSTISAIPLSSLHLQHPPLYSESSDVSLTGGVHNHRRTLIPSLRKIDLWVITYVKSCFVYYPLELLLLDTHV